MTNDVASNYLWYEKYRPKTLDDLVLEDSYREIFQKYIDNQEIPHLLFIGPPGSGKTTLSKILINSILESDDDLMYINGSSKKDRSVSNIDEIADSFLSGAIISSKIKILFIDEADGLKNDAQRSLKNIIEHYSAKNRFIMTCNDFQLINSAIQSRFSQFYFKPLDTTPIYKNMEKILLSEKINFKESDLKQIINIYKPDMRTIINTCERLVVVDGDSKTLRFSKQDILGLGQSEKSLVTIIKQTTQGRKDSQNTSNFLNKIVSFTSENYLNYKLVLTFLFEQETDFQKKYIWGKYLNSIKGSVSEKAHLFCAIWDCLS